MSWVRLVRATQCRIDGSAGLSMSLLPPYEGLTDEEAELSLAYYQKHQVDVQSAG